MAQISKTPGAKYCSVDSAHEFERIITKEFPYDVTIIGFNIQITLNSKDYEFVKGYGSPEVNSLQCGQPVKISSEFPCIYDEYGQAKGGIFLFQLDKKAGREPTEKAVKIKVSWEDTSGISHEKAYSVPLTASSKDPATRKAVALVRYVDLHNDYVLEEKSHPGKYIELFQMFKEHFVNELTAVGDISIDTNNKGDIELLDKIIELESAKPQSKQSKMQPSKSAFGSTPTKSLRSPTHQRQALTKAPLKQTSARRKTTAKSKSFVSPPSSAPRRSMRIRDQAASATHPNTTSSTRKRVRSSGISAAKRLRSK